MKWINGLTYERKQEIKTKKREKFGVWHKWFAWYPVIVGINNESRQIKVWLEATERRGILHAPRSPWIYQYWIWEYRYKGE